MGIRTRQRLGATESAARTPRAVLWGWLVVTASVLAGCGGADSSASATRYVTEYGLGPDKWAAAWLLTRHADPQGQLIVVDPGTPIVDGVSFDLPTSTLRRIGNRSTFEVVKTTFELDDPLIDALLAIVHEIEVNFWTASGPPEAVFVEDAFRTLQYRHGRDLVAPACYVAFFDRVYELLQDEQLRGVPFNPDRLDLSCNELSRIAEQRNALIPELPAVDVLSAMAAGKNVVFVDVREPDEYAEAHIPGALNIPIREVRPALKERLAGADYVVSYCVKDFRGFEMAKALSQIGVEHSVILRPYGIKGWVSLGLPVVGTQGLSAADAQATLDQCLESGECLPAADASRSTT